MKLRDYQREILAASGGEDNVLIQADTGAGKTRILAAIAKQHTHVLLVAHRNLLLAQLSLEFARAGLSHSFIASQQTQRQAILRQRRELGVEHIVDKSTCIACSIDTLLSRFKREKLSISTKQQWLIIVDEAHHMVEQNKWGKLCDIFKKSRIIGATATPVRLDGVLLKKGKGGVFDRLVQAESLKENSVSKLIERGYISEFRCFGVEPAFDTKKLVLGKHDYTTASTTEAFDPYVEVMAGDAVKHYKRLANNKQALVFCISIVAAKKIANMFKQAGFAAAAIHSKMSNTEVQRVFDAYRNRLVQVLVNVDMVGEGVDVPAIEVLILLRKTASLGLYRQWIGRGLRVHADKKHTVIIDHADNIRTHGLPDRHIKWSLDRLPPEQKQNLILCFACGFLYNAWLFECPNCGHKAVESQTIAERHSAFVDYNLVELHRSKAAKAAYDAAPAGSLEPEDIKYLVNSGGQSIQICNKVALWFYENIKHKVTRGEIESFMFKYNFLDFWATYFTLADTRKQNEKKCWKVFRKYSES